ncbi:transmembrane protein, putative (macronuclear) [Tetrahymena thermophila SB210]|uniref:Transmembrane protein, putative n=1 Tax=Tetrahymena thermophila (strain SB210) TaxID=312017 RepID=W7XB13_TETTS|nr:transmembrane protein, putative [Tetrahymena thermophila SB210]EWS73618.1 transmembrane protein, putative [Tetrahymena thermophila SB210]|eukprot:XP_012653848.1 transmembrane protein, putative [Tetrahymena thermophila SB210]
MTLLQKLPLSSSQKNLAHFHLFCLKNYLLNSSKILLQFFVKRKFKKVKFNKNREMEKKRKIRLLRNFSTFITKLFLILLMKVQIFLDLTSHLEALHMLGVRVKRTQSFALLLNKTQIQSQKRLRKKQLNGLHSYVEQQMSTKIQINVLYAVKKILKLMISQNLARKVTNRLFKAYQKTIINQKTSTLHNHVKKDSPECFQLRFLKTNTNGNYMKMKRQKFQWNQVILFLKNLQKKWSTKQLIQSEFKIKPFKQKNLKLLYPQVNKQYLIKYFQTQQGKQQFKQNRFQINNRSINQIKFCNLRLQLKYFQTNLLDKQINFKCIHLFSFYKVINFYNQQFQNIFYSSKIFKESSILFRNYYFLIYQQLKLISLFYHFFLVFFILLNIKKILYLILSFIYIQKYINLKKLKRK